MKAIKLFGLFLASVIVGSSFYGCKKDEYESRINELILKDMFFISDASIDTLKFRHEDLSHYSISSDSSWCHPEILKESSQIVIRVDANEKFDERVTAVKIKDMVDTTKTRSFNVTQDQRDALLIDDPFTHFSVPTAGQDVTVKINSNVTYTVEIDEANKDWIAEKKAASTRGLAESSVILSVAKNESGADRTGYAYIFNDNEPTARVKITIDQKFDAKLTVDPMTLTIDELGGIVKVTVKANIDYDVYSQVDWVSKSSTKELSDSTTSESFRVEEFTDRKKSRTGYIIIENAAYDDLQQKIKVTQTRALYIEDADNISVDMGKTVKLTLTNTTGDDNVTWTSSNKSFATVSADGTVTGVAAGSATITVTSADEEHTYSAKVTVNKVEEKKEESKEESSSK